MNDQEKTREELIIELQQLRQENTSLKALYRELPSAITITMVRNGKFIEINDAFSSITGYTREEAMADSTVGLNIWADPEEREQVELLLHKGVDIQGNVCQFQKKNGAIFSGLLSARIILLNNEPCILSSINDITEHRLVEEALHEIEEKFREMAGMLPQIVFETDMNGNLTYVNKYAYTSFGYPEDAVMLGVSTLNFYPPDERVRAIENIRRRLSGQQSDNHEYTMVRNDGSTFQALIYSNPILKDNVAVGLRGIIVDITERKEAENEIRKLNETLEERVAERTRELENINKELAFHIREIEQFTYIASHDLQEPLRTLASFTALIQEEYAGKLGEDGNKYIEHISSSSNRMSMLVKGLLDYSLLGKLTDRTTVNCNKIVAEVIADLDGSIKKTNAEIILQEELPKIIGFEPELRLLFGHLIVNALKFQKTENRPEIRISAENQDKEWLFKIRDNGIGIEEKDKEKIFVIFKRMHNRNEYGGTGIGLAHCKKIVELHKGKIWVESTPGEGSTFTFTIPMQTDQQN
ncbi:MAG: PAS domain S-box protein [Bacteroidetes bacterium]|nr:PAS domain S-box protein [Bacteroidota bacterium]